MWKIFGDLLGVTIREEYTEPEKASERYAEIAEQAINAQGASSQTVQLWHLGHCISQTLVNPK